MVNASSRSGAEALDAVDPLAVFRDRFVIADGSTVYLDGNSLGRLSHAARARLHHVIDVEWGTDLIRSWDHWVDLPQRVGDLIGTHLLGARPGEVIVSDSTTVNLYKLVVAAADHQQARGRSVIVADASDFPTDRYVVEGVARQRRGAVRWIDRGAAHDPVGVDDVAPLLDDGVALVVLSHVHYRSGALCDMAAVTAAAHDAGALVLWDLSHSGGSVPIALGDADVDLAVGCTYKYLNGGPGAPAYLYVHRRWHGVLQQPIWGWWGQADMFAMGPGYDPPSVGVQQHLVGTPPILPLVAAEEGVKLLAEAGLPALRDKGMALTSFAVQVLDEHLAPLGFTLASPRDPQRRGSHVSLAHPDARRLCAALVAAGVIPDFREPDVIRFGLAPLTTRFVDVWDGLDRLRSLTAG